jgi:hypothetical protein
MDLEFELYKGKKFSSLLKDIVTNSEDRNDKLERLIKDLSSMVKTPNDAIIIIPLIREYLDITVKNDEQLVKLAAIVQRLISSNTKDNSDSGFMLTEEDLKKLNEEVDIIKKQSDEPIVVKEINK